MARSRGDQPPPHEVRLMTAEDVQEGLAIFAKNHLSESAHGLATFREIDPQGFFVAVDTNTGNLSLTYFRV